MSSFLGILNDFILPNKLYFYFVTFFFEKLLFIVSFCLCFIVLFSYNCPTSIKWQQFNIFLTENNYTPKNTITQWNKTYKKFIWKSKKRRKDCYKKKVNLLQLFFLPFCLFVVSFSTKKGSHHKTWKGIKMNWIHMKEKKTWKLQNKIKQISFPENLK